jgi:hypothetical protein
MSRNSILPIFADLAAAVIHHQFLNQLYRQRRSAAPDFRERRDGLVRT